MKRVLLGMLGGIILLASIVVASPLVTIVTPQVNATIPSSILQTEVLTDEPALCEYSLCFTTIDQGGGSSGCSQPRNMSTTGGLQHYQLITDLSNTLNTPTIQQFYTFRTACRNLNGTGRTSASFFVNITEPILTTDCREFNLPGATYILQNDIVSDDDEGCFRITAGNIVFNLNGHTIRGENSERGVYSLSSVDNVIIKNGKITQFSTGITLSGDNIYILEVILNDTQRGIVMTGNHHFINDVAINSLSDAWEGIHLSDSFNATLTNVMVNGGRQGIYIDHGSHNLIQDSYVVNTLERAAIIFDSSSNNRIINTLLDNNKLNLYVSASQESQCNHVLSNVSDLTGRLTLLYAGRVKVKNIEVNELFLCNADDSFFTNVTIAPSSNQHQNGLFIFLTDRASFSDVVVNNTEEGIFLHRSTSNSFLKVQSSNNYLRGILLSASHKNLVSNSKFFTNTGYGIHIVESKHNTIKDNYAITNDYYGLALEDSSSNLIYNNFLSDVLDMSTIVRPFPNSWNIPLTRGRNIIGGPFLGGNYWTNHEGNGFSQTCSDVDDNGICDNIYNLGGNNFDYSPLTSIS